MKLRIVFPRKQHIFRLAVSVFVASALLAQPLLPAVFAQPFDQSAYSAKMHSPNEVHLKFTENSGVVLEDGLFISQSAPDITGINAIIAQKVTSKDRLFTDNYNDIQKQHVHLKSKYGKQLANLNNYFVIKLRSGVDTQAVLDQLRQLPYIAEAYYAPLPAPAPVTPDYANLQTYRHTAPGGMGVNAVTAQVGAKGDNVQIADIEYSWNTGHEDISDGAQAGARLANGTPADPFNDDNHGTAVTGITNGDVNTSGIDGIVPNSKLKLVNAYNAERGWDLANSIYLAQANLLPGDIMLIEQQTYGPSGTLVPVEWVPAIYDAITYATANGIIVVEAAANGGQNLDDPVYGATFPSGKANSGAIIVGAGAACGTQSNRSRLSFSNYGSRVDVQGWGECVTTTGYGSLSGTVKNQWYTSQFNGTSSASALVAAAAASISSAKEAQLGTHMTSLQMRNLLVSTGSTQDTSSISGKIGPLPNLPAALGVDTLAPSAPAGLMVTSVSLNVIALKWTAATDNVGIKTYEVYRNGVLLAKTGNSAYSDSLIKRNTSYTYKVRALDAAGNTSGFSNIVSVTTPRK